MNNRKESSPLYFDGYIGDGTTAGFMAAAAAPASASRSARMHEASAPSNDTLFEHMEFPLYFNGYMGRGGSGSLGER